MGVCCGSHTRWRCFIDTEAADEPRILIADDDQAFCDVVSAALSMQGYITRQVATVDEVLAELAVAPWDLLLLDTLSAPLAAAAQSAISQICECAGTTPVMLVTGWWEVAAWAEAEPGIASVLRKPFDLEPFLASVADLVTSARRT
jgi:two-component system response regulator RegA